MKPNVLKGHTLPFEGRVNTFHGWRNVEGSTQCSCGVVSPRLPNTAARQRWHRQHKDEIRAQQADA